MWIKGGLFHLFFPILASAEVKLRNSRFTSYFRALSDHMWDLVNKTNLLHNFFLVCFFLSIFISPYMFRVTMCPSSGETTVFMWQLVLVILFGWLSDMQGEIKKIVWGCFFAIVHSLMVGGWSHGCIIHRNRNSHHSAMQRFLDKSILINTRH